MLVLMENDIWDFSNSIVAPLYPKYLVTHKIKDMKDKNIILEGVKYHLIPHLSGRQLSGTCGRL
jgi:hypothetical protein